MVSVCESNCEAKRANIDSQLLIMVASGCLTAEKTIARCQDNAIIPCAPASCHPHMPGWREVGAFALVGWESGRRRVRRYGDFA